MTFESAGNCIFMQWHWRAFVDFSIFTKFFFLLFPHQMWCVRKTVNFLFSFCGDFLYFLIFFSFIFILMILFFLFLLIYLFIYFLLNFHFCFFFSFHFHFIFNFLFTFSTFFHCLLWLSAMGKLSTAAALAVKISFSGVETHVCR